MLIIVLLIVLIFAFMIVLLVYKNKAKGGSSTKNTNKVASGSKLKSQGVSVFEKESIKSEIVRTPEINGDFLDIFLKKPKLDFFEGDFIPLTLDRIEEAEIRVIRSKLNSIPPLPNVAHELIMMLGDEKTSSRHVSEIASKDPVLVGKLLQLVNSSFFGLSKEVTSIGRAIVLLGFNTVKNFVLQNQLTQVISDINKDIFPIKDFWVHSLASSVCSYQISFGVVGVQSSVISTTALLHDIGKLAMAFYKPQKYKEYVAIVNEENSKPSLVLEEKVFGINHALVGSLLAESWELPEVIQNVILYHHHPTFVSVDGIPEEYRKAATIVHLSDLVCKLCGLTITNKDITGVKDEFYQLIGMAPSLENLINQKITVEMQKAKYFVSSQMKI